MDRLSFISHTTKRTNDGHKIGLYRCECGNVKELTISRVKNGQTKSCGCLLKINAFRTHGMRYTPEYRIWGSMRNRAFNPNNKNYDSYGPMEHDAILDSFQAFYDHIGPRPSRSHSVDRIDNTKGYQFNNVRWATRSEQQRNTKRSARVWIKGIVFDCASDAAAYFNVTTTSVSRWLNGSYDARRNSFTPPKAWAWRENKYG